MSYPSEITGDSKLEEMARRAIDNGECAVQLEIKDTDLRESLIRNIVPELERARRERDQEWAAAIDPQNVGTDYGEFLADPKRAALLLKEREALLEQARREGEHTWKEFDELLESRAKAEARVRELEAKLAEAQANMDLLQNGAKTGLNAVQDVGKLVVRYMNCPHCGGSMQDTALAAERAAHEQTRERVRKLREALGKIAGNEQPCCSYECADIATSALRDEPEEPKNA